MTPWRFKCTRFRKGILDYSLECITLLQNDFFKQRYIKFNVTIPGQDRIDPNTYMCRSFFTGYICVLRVKGSCALNINWMIEANCHVFLGWPYVLFVFWLFVILVISRFGFEGWIWVLIACKSVYLFNFGKTFLTDLCWLYTFEDVIQPLQKQLKWTCSHVCCMHSMLFSSTLYDIHGKTVLFRTCLIKLFRPNIIIYLVARDVPLTN